MPYLKVSASAQTRTGALSLQWLLRLPSTDEAAGLGLVRVVVVHTAQQALTNTARLLLRPVATHWAWRGLGAVLGAVVAWHKPTMNIIITKTRSS